jgi:hypothetical protein
MKTYTNKFVAVAMIAATLTGLIASPEVASARTAQEFCPSAQKAVRSFSKRLGISAPSVELSDTGSTYYLRTKWMIKLAADDCGKKSVVAHEYGHYVVDVAANGELDEFLRLSALFTSGSNWLRTSKDEGGWERAAHCVGHALAGYGAYTKCPHRSLRTAAVGILDLASNAVRP